MSRDESTSSLLPRDAKATPSYGLDYDSAGAGAGAAPIVVPVAPQLRTYEAAAGAGAGAAAPTEEKAAVPILAPVMTREDPVRTSGISIDYILPASSSVASHGFVQWLDDVFCVSRKIVKENNDDYFKYHGICIYEDDEGCFTLDMCRWPVMALCCPAAEFDLSILKAHTAGLDKLIGFTGLQQPFVGTVFSYLNVTEQFIINELLEEEGSCYTFANCYFKQCNLSYRVLEGQPDPKQVNPLNRVEQLQKNQALELKVKYPWAASLAWFCGLSCSKLVCAPCAIPISHCMVNVGRAHKMDALSAAWDKRGNDVDVKGYEKLTERLGAIEYKDAAAAFARLQTLGQMGCNHAVMRTKEGVLAVVKINKAADGNEKWRAFDESARHPNKFARKEGKENIIKVCHPDHPIEYILGQTFFAIRVDEKIEIVDAPAEQLQLPLPKQQEETSGFCAIM